MIGWFYLLIHPLIILCKKIFWYAIFLGLVTTQTAICWVIWCSSRSAGTSSVCFYPLPFSLSLYLLILLSWILVEYHSPFFNIVWSNYSWTTLSPQQQLYYIQVRFVLVLLQIEDANILMALFFCVYSNDELIMLLMIRQEYVSECMSLNLSPDPAACQTSAGISVMLKLVFDQALQSMSKRGVYQVLFIYIMYSPNSSKAVLNGFLILFLNSNSKLNLRSSYV